MRCVVKELHYTCSYQHEPLYGSGHNILLPVANMPTCQSLLCWHNQSRAQPKLRPLASLPGRVAQSVTCLATDACLTAIPGVSSSIPARSHTFVEIDHEILSTVILLPSVDSFKKGCCQLQAKVCARITGHLLVQACPGKSVVR